MKNAKTVPQLKAYKNRTTKSWKYRRFFLDSTYLGLEHILWGPSNTMLIKSYEGYMLKIGLNFGWVFGGYAK
jgi:hypothetical protein